MPDSLRMMGAVLQSPPPKREKHEMVWQCPFCKASTPATEYKCRNCGAPR